MKISVTMITMNEEQNIARALSSCSFADEIVVVDGGSTDNTLDILEAHDKVLLLQRPWENHFARQRQASLDHCTGDWVIRLDSDEAFSMAFEQNIRELLSSSSDDIAGYNVRQCNLVGNEKYYSKIYDDFEATPRIWRNSPDVKWEGPIHEILTGIQGEVKCCEVYVVHYGFLDKKKYRKKGEFYSRLPDSGFSNADELVYREYDIQPRPIESMVAQHVPEYVSDYELSEKGEIAIVGNCINVLKGHNLQEVSERYNLSILVDEVSDIHYSQTEYHNIKFPGNKADFGALIGLEFELFDKDIICTEGITSTHTNQAVRAKLKFGKKLLTVINEPLTADNEMNNNSEATKELALRYVDIFIVFSESSRNELLLKGVPGERISVIPEVETDSIASSGNFTEIIDNVFLSTFKGAIGELSDYTRLTEKDTLKRIRSVYSQQIQDWKGTVGGELTKSRVAEFYRDTDSYLFDLIQYNYENKYYVQWSMELLNLCADLIKERGHLNILDFGGGTGSQLINVSALKGAELCYADIPGKTFNYARSRFEKRKLNIHMLDATKEDFLGNMMFDVVFAFDVIEHLVDPEESVEYLVRHIKPDGFLVAIASFADNNGEAGWHLNVDKYTNEGFYSLIRSLGMEMMTEGMPRLFRKDMELSSLIENLKSAKNENRFKDARKYIELYLDCRPVDLHMLVTHYEICLTLGDREAAMESLNKIRLFNPDMAEALGLDKLIQKEKNETTSCQ